MQYMQVSFCSMDWETSMRNGYQPETKQQEDPYLKNSNNLEPKNIKCSAGKFL